MKRFEVVLNEFDEIDYIMDKNLMIDMNFNEFMEFVEELSLELEDKSQDDYIDCLKQENKELKQTIENLKLYDEEDWIEVKHINNIYREFGFDGVIEYAKDKLSLYGVVREEEPGLYVMATGGWSDHENWINCLNNPASLFCMRHYRANTTGGAFYYTEEPHARIDIKLKNDSTNSGNEKMGV